MLELLSAYKWKAMSTLAVPMTGVFGSVGEAKRRQNWAGEDGAITGGRWELVVASTA